MIRLAILAFALGCAWLQTRPALASLAWSGMLPLAWLAAWWLPGNGPWRHGRHAALLLAALASGFLYATWRADLRLADELPALWEGRDITLTGRIVGLPEPRPHGPRFVLEADRVHTPGAQIPTRLLLTAYVAPGLPAPALAAGDCLRLSARLHRPHGLANPGGFDFEAWLLERDLRATGTIKGEITPDSGCAGDLLAFIDPARESLRARLRLALGEAPYAGIVVALALGDQNAIPDRQWTLFRQTGVSHLFSVSGLHITLFAALVLAAVNALWRRLPSLALRLPARRAGIALGLLAALAYALISGWGIPAQRTLYMLAGAAAAAWLDRAPAPSRLLAAALLPVVLADPWAALSPGFWLSFSAVAALLWSGMGRIHPGRPWQQALHAQWAVTLALTPLLLALFHEVSLVSPLANAFAIPAVSLLAVPLSLLGALSPWDAPAWLAHAVIQAVMAFLEALTALPQTVFHTAAPSWPALTLAALGSLWLLLPRGVPGRWLGLLLFLPLLFPRLPAPATGEAWITLLDVGQGQSLVVRTARHVMVVDTGPAYSGQEGANAGARIVAPYLWSQGINRLDGLIVSHDDIDHSGGAGSLIAGHNPGWILSSIAGASTERISPTGQHILANRPDTIPCATGQHWSWDGVQFKVLNPDRDQYGRTELSDNQMSCALKIQTPDNALMVTGDLDSTGERHLIEAGNDLSSDVLVVGHHGSKHSTTEDFLKAVQPRHALISAGRNNRYGHPHPETMARLKHEGIETHHTPESGALYIRMEQRGLTVSSHATETKRYWQRLANDRTAPIPDAPHPP